SLKKRANQRMRSTSATAGGFTFLFQMRILTFTASMTKPAPAATWVSGGTAPRLLSARLMPTNPTPGPMEILEAVAGPTAGPEFVRVPELARAFALSNAATSSCRWKRLNLLAPPLGGGNLL